MSAGSHPQQDYELLEEATGIRRQRPTQQHRRIKKARDAEGGSAAQQDAARALQVGDGAGMWGADGLGYRGGWWQVCCSWAATAAHAGWHRLCPTTCLLSGHLAA